MSRIPPNQMQACRNEDDAGRIVEFFIRDRRHDATWSARMDNSRGAGCAGWMGGPLDTPLGLFAELSVFPGFRDREITTLALQEFAKVEDQHWEQELLQRADLIGDGEDGPNQ
ncbi:MAG: hypothetical protein K2X11_08140 [Acetobacteraceae bacterium]|nr:hypothetical protein [Acetobacteraceae bacterium]